MKIRNLREFPNEVDTCVVCARVNRRKPCRPEGPIPFAKCLMQFGTSEFPDFTDEQ